MWTSMEKSRPISSLYYDLLQNIRMAFVEIPKNKVVFHSALKNLQETLISMKPLLLVQMDQTMEQNFRKLFVELDSLIPNLDSFKTMVLLNATYMTTLEDLKENLRIFFRNYVLDQLKIISEVKGTYGPAEGGVTNVNRLSGELRNMIKTEMPMASNSIKPILKELDIILESLTSNDLENTSELLCLLKGVRVCVKFLNGHHGIDIHKHLLDYEQGLRRLVKEMVRKKLEDQDRDYEERRRKKAKEGLDMILFCTATILTYLTYAPQTPISSFFFLAAVTLFVFIFNSESPEKAKDGDSNRVNLFFAAIVVALFTCPTETLIYCVIAIGAIVVSLNFYKSEIHDIYILLSTKGQTKECEDPLERHIKEGDDESNEILVLTATIVGTTFGCFAYWHNTTFSCIVFIVVIVQLANLIKSKIFVGQRRHAKVELEDVIMYFYVIFAVGAVILFLSLFKPEIPGKEDINNEIFLSFRGSDTRYIFASSLHNNLEKANIRTFFDERNMRKGKQIWEELQREIRTSVGAIIIISQNYAESEDCLDELLQIQKRARKYQHYILKPIFYDVQPEHLTDKQSKFYQRLKKHRNTKKIKEWAAALETLTGFAGYTYTSNWEHMDLLIDRIVGDVKRYLRSKNGRQIRKQI